MSTKILALPLAALLLTAVLLPPASATAEEGKHLFILSGQSNMAGHKPDEAFTPAVSEALGEDKVIVIQDAMGGQPIQRWWKPWKGPDGKKPEKTGDLYDRLLGKVKPAIEGEKIATVTFFWMQGERDAKMGWGEVYAESLKGLHTQLSEDLGRDDVNFVIGRLSDFGLEKNGVPHWTVVREAQVEVAESSPRFTWIDTDDLNDGTNRRGKKIENDLHYSAEGYRILGERFAASALELIEKNAD